MLDAMKWMLTQLTSERERIAETLLAVPYVDRFAEEFLDMCKVTIIIIVGPAGWPRSLGFWPARRRFGFDPRHHARNLRAVRELAGCMREPGLENGLSLGHGH